MKQFIYIFLYLNIYTTFFFTLNSQNFQLQITGEDLNPKEIIDSLGLEVKFKNYISLKVAAEEFQNKLQQIGYLESELKTIDKKNDSIFTATYYFGNKYSEIKIYYSNIDFTKKEITSITNQYKVNYFILPINKIESSLKKLSNLKTKGGNSFARIHLEDFNSTKQGVLTARLILLNSKKRTIDDFIIKGYEKFSISHLKYYAGIKKGKPFNKEEIITKSNSLDNLGFVSNIKPPEALFKKDSTIIYFYLKKEKNNLFDGVIGFSTNEETQKLIFNGYLNLELNNNLNFGEKLLLNYKADGNEQQNFRAKISLPYILKSPLGVDLELLIFKRDSTFVTTEQQARVNYQINPNTNSNIGYKSYDSSNLLDEENNIVTVEDYNSRFFVLGASYYKQQNNSLFPVKTHIDIGSEIGSRKIENTNESQYRLNGTIHHIFNLNFKNSIFLKNNTRILSSDTYLTNELFRFGGITSIRGFNENSIDASFYSVINSEYRYQFGDGIYIHTIIDGAYFENEILDLKEKLYSFGIGLGLQTKAGLLRLNIANGNTENQVFSFSNTKIHFSISSRF